MYHPFVTRAKEKGAYSAYAEAGSDGSVEYLYDAVVHQEYNPTLMAIAPCCFHTPNYRSDIKVSPLGMPLGDNVGIGTGVRAGSPMEWTNIPDTGTNPQEGPDYFKKDGCLEINGTGFSKEHATQVAYASGTTAYNPAGLTSYLLKSFVIWYRLKDHADGEDRGVIWSIEHSPPDTTNNIEFSLDSQNTPIWKVGTRTFEQPCGQLAGGNEFGGHWCNDRWHMAVLTTDADGRYFSYQDGRLVDSGSTTWPTMPSEPEFYCHFNRTGTSNTAGFTEYELGPASIVNGMLREEEVSRLWRAMWRTSDAIRVNNSEVRKFRESDEQPLRRSDLAFTDRLLGTSTLSTSVGMRDTDGIAYGNHFRLKNKDSDGFSLFCMQQLSGTPFGEDTPKVKYFESVTSLNSLSVGCCYDTTVVDYSQQPWSGINITRDNRKAQVSGYGRTAAGTYVEDYDWESATNLLAKGGFSYSDLGTYECFATAVDSTGVLWVGGQNEETDTTVSPAASHFPSHNGQSDVPHSPKGIGKDEDQGTNNGEDHSLYGPIAHFDKKLTVSEIRELERICMGQVPLRSIRPTRGLLRQTALMAPGRIME